MPADTGSKQAREKIIALLTAREIFDLVRDDLVLVEQELTRQTSATFEPVSEIPAIFWVAAASDCDRRCCCFPRDMRARAIVRERFGWAQWWSCCTAPR